jgi:beta-hydroxyacyl-ACP dehydratase FabZ
MSENKTPEIIMDVNRIKEILPHRYPFLMLDRVIELDHEIHRIVAIKNVTVNEPFFQGHYPGLPVFPGVLQIEAMAQAACLSLLDLPGYEGKTPFFTGISDVKFRRQVVPGDQIRIEANVLKLRSRAAKCEATCTVDGQVTSNAKLTCMLVDAEEK